MSKKIIDVSSYQGVIDWKKVKASGVEGAILKIVRKDLAPDKQFENNWKGCSDAGIPVVGVYNYSYATTVAKAKYDAQTIVNILAGRRTKVWLDVEDKCQKGLGSKLIDIIHAYWAVIEASGLEFGVYTGISFYNSYIKKYASIINCNFWIARYPSSLRKNVSYMPPDSKKPAIKHIMEGWQYTSKCIVPGVSGNADMSVWYGNAASGQSVTGTMVYGGLDYSPVFNAIYYANRYGDLKVKYGYDSIGLFTHFIANGMKEGRQAIETFNVQTYKARYSDLQKAFGENLQLYYQHYIQHGKNEKRIAI